MIRWIVLQRGGTLQERVPPCLCLAQTILPSSRREAETNGLVPSRLTAGQSLAKGFNLYAYPAGTSFCSCKRKQNTLGETPRPPTLDCAGYGYCFSAAAEKQIRTARRCAPKVACGGIFFARALEREGRTTTPLLPLSLQCRTASLVRSHCSCRSPRNCRCFRHRRRSNSLPLKGGELWGQ